MLFAVRANTIYDSNEPLGMIKKKREREKELDGANQPPATPE